MKPLLTIDQAAEVLSISVRQLLYLTQDGALPYINIGRGMRMMRRYDPVDLQAFMQERKKSECQSSLEKTRKMVRTPMSSNYKVVDFQETLARRRNAKQGR